MAKREAALPVAHNSRRVYSSREERSGNDRVVADGVDRVNATTVISSSLFSVSRAPSAARARARAGPAFKGRHER